MWSSALGVYSQVSLPRPTSPGMSLQTRGSREKVQTQAWSHSGVSAVASLAGPERCWISAFLAQGRSGIKDNRPQLSASSYLIRSLEKINMLMEESQKNTKQTLLQTVPSPVHLRIKPNPSIRML